MHLQINAWISFYKHKNIKRQYLYEIINKIFKVSWLRGKHYNYNRNDLKCLQN